ncbi:MAG: hypothetical protein H6817_06395 [Phycisphaerales bacterium]|nr:hypothetical protein [Phycisphaerales bacterium]
MMMANGCFFWVIIAVVVGVTLSCGNTKGARTCKQCGAGNRRLARFCSRCGNRLRS